MKIQFEMEIYKEAGANAAIIIEVLVKALAWNNGCLNAKGNRWLKMSLKDYEEMFPYMTLGQIRGGLHKAESLGYVNKDSFNEDVLDTTKWYSLTDKTKNIYGI